MKQLRYIQLQANYFRKLIHSHGIAWTRSINADVRVNRITNRDEYEENQNRTASIDLLINWSWTLHDVLADADFCLWKSFPFQQMIQMTISTWSESLELEPLKPTCLFFWLSNQQYNNTSLDCDYQRFLNSCHDREFRASAAWDLYDTKQVSKGVEIGLSVLAKAVYILGIVTNSILVHLIWSKKTRDFFKDQKHYPYLGAISIFNIIILVIELLSWISDCQDESLDVFCPKSRKLVFIQFFKVNFHTFEMNVSIFYLFPRAFSLKKFIFI